MSWVNNVILTYSAAEPEWGPIETVNAALHEKWPSQHFLEADDFYETWYGGTKCLECAVHVAAFDGLPLEDLCAALRTVPWCEPEHVRLFWCGQEDHAFEPVNWRTYGSDERRD